MKTKNHGQLHIVKRTRKKKPSKLTHFRNFSNNFEHFICTSWFALLNLKKDIHDS